MTEAQIIREAMRLMGARTSAKKAASSKANGLLGGRPRKPTKIPAVTSAVRSRSAS
jgi:hypothetical protein